GMPAGELGADQTYPGGTINHLIMKRFTEISEALKEKKEQKEEDEAKAKDPASTEEQKTKPPRKSRMTPHGAGNENR
ncbi:MAG TPA: hypothetical protein VN328_05095, partial [Thermodesulfovibrionales bacterium]|nr:hypothetical protein [Thermodesulfovibrionales bacterium]